MLDSVPNEVSFLRFEFLHLLTIFLPLFVNRSIVFITGYLADLNIKIRQSVLLNSKNIMH